MPAKFLYNLTKNLSAHIQHKFCAVLPILISRFNEAELSADGNIKMQYAIYNYYIAI